MIALGLLLLAAAAIVALVGVLANVGGAHALNSDFSLFGYHLHGSTGQLLLIGVIVGAVGMLGLTMLLAGLGRISRRVTTRRELKQTRRQADSLHQERQTLAYRPRARAGRPGWPPSRVPPPRRPRTPPTHPTRDRPPTSRQARSPQLEALKGGERPLSRPGRSNGAFRRGVR